MEFELGISPEVREITRLTYTAHDEASGYTEREFDHVVVGEWGGDVRPRPDEVQGVDWVYGRDLAVWMRERPTEFVPWLSLILANILKLSEQRIAGFEPLPEFVRSFRAV